MSKPVLAMIKCAGILILHVALWVGLTAFVVWQWPIQFWAWSASERGIYVIISAIYLFTAACVAAMAAIESLTKDNANG